MNMDTSRMINIEDMSTHKLDNSDELIALSKERMDFLKSQQWCKRIIQGKLDRGWGYIIAVFLFISQWGHP